METGKEVLILNLDDVLPNRFQPRIKFNEQSIIELAESIREHGVIQPIVVRKIADKYEIIAGERRYKASVLAGKTTIPAIVTDLDDKNSAEVALIENVQRQDLTPIEEAISYKKILDMGYLNQATLADKLGKTQSTIANKLRLLNLDDEVQEALLGEKISERHARSLLKLDKENQVKMLNRILTERMTVRKTDEEIMKLFGRKKEENTNVVNEVNMTNQNTPLNSMGVEMNGNQIMSQPPVMQPVEPMPVVDPTPIQGHVMDKSIAEQPIPMRETEPVINPGFMDIDKIQAQAQDIFPKPVEPSVEEQPVEKVEPLPLVNDTMQPVANTLVEEEPSGESKNDIKPTTGRFFNMFNMNREEQENPNYVSNIEEKEVNMNFEQKTSNPAQIFNFKPLGQEQQFENAQPMEQTSSVTPVQTPQFETVQPMTQTSPVSPVQTPQFGNAQPMEQTSPVSPVQTPQFGNAQPMEQTSPISPVQTTQFENPQPFVAQPNFNNAQPSKPTFEAEETFETVNPYTLTDDSEFTGPVIAPAEIVESNRMSTMPSTPVELQPLTEETTENNVTVDMKTVINTVRDCVSIIEGYGYVVDEDEIDLENSYQITITIDKR